MVSSISSAKQGTVEYIHNITVDLSRTYVKSRLECVQAVMDGDVDGEYPRFLRLIVPLN